MVKNVIMQFHTAGSVDVQYHLENKTVTFQFQTEGKRPVAVTTPLHELERLYQNIDQLCRGEHAPFVPVKVA